MYDKAGKNLIVFEGELQRYSFDEATLELTAQERVRAGNVSVLVLSPDGSQLAAPAGGGNGNGYSVFDFNSGNLNEKNGEWNVGAYPSGAAFFTKKDLFAALNHDAVKIFHKTTHALINEIKLDKSECGYSNSLGMSVSRQEDLVFVSSQCGFDRDSGVVFWSKVNLTEFCSWSVKSDQLPLNLSLSQLRTCLLKSPLLLNESVTLPNLHFSAIGQKVWSVSIKTKASQVLDGFSHDFPALLN
ncbi:MAG TPA: hypothetical protein VE954_34960 [Oligoflexus sp.]|nr:hypothetical protein [Oligoflexus sp.]HYX38332.1 hypothetical protein [Oligoflexus sp.]